MKQQPGAAVAPALIARALRALPLDCQQLVISQGYTAVRFIGAAVGVCVTYSYIQMRKAVTQQFAVVCKLTFLARFSV